MMHTIDAVLGALRATERAYSVFGQEAATTGTVTLVGTIVTYLIFRMNRKRDRIARTFDFLEKWKEKDFQAARDHVMTAMKPALTAQYIDRGFPGLTPPDFAAARKVCNFLGFVGDAMILGYLDDRLLLHEIGTPVARLWMVLGPLLDKERKRRDTEWSLEIGELAGHSGPVDRRYVERYADGFEYLAVRARGFRQGKAFPFHKFRWPVDPPK